MTKLRFTAGSTINYKRKMGTELLLDAKEMANLPYIIAAMVEPTTWENFNNFIDSEEFQSMYETGLYLEGLEVMQKALKK